MVALGDLYEALVEWVGPGGDLSDRAEDADLDPIKGAYDQDERTSSYPATAVTFERFLIAPATLAAGPTKSFDEIYFRILYIDQFKSEEAAALGVLQMADVLLESLANFEMDDLRAGMARPVGELDFTAGDRDPLIRGVVATLQVRR